MENSLVALSSPTSVPHFFSKSIEIIRFFLDAIASLEPGLWVGSMVGELVKNSIIRIYSRAKKFVVFFSVALHSTKIL